MNTTIELSLPPEQLALLQAVYEQQQRILDRANGVAWLTDEMVAKRLHVSISTLRRWRTEHDMPFVQIGDTRLYHPNEVDQWMILFSPSNVFSMGKSKRVG